MKTHESLCRARREAISTNRSRRMRGLLVSPVPAKPTPPMGYEIHVDGTYAGYYPIDNRRGAMASAKASGLSGKIVLKRTELRN